MSKHETYDEERVLQLLAQGSEYAFTQIFDYYRPIVYTTAVKFLKSPVLAEEIVQDIFLKVWLKREKMGAVQNFEGYLFLMTRNLIFDRIKKQAHEMNFQKELSKNNSTAGSVNDTDHLVQDHHYQQILQQAIALLPAQQKMVYCLSKMEGLSRAQIAERMHISPLTVKTHLGKALLAIRKYLKDYLPVLYIPLLLFVLGNH